MGGLPVRFAEQGVPAIEGDHPAIARLRGGGQRRTKARLDRDEHVLDRPFAADDDVFVCGEFAHRLPAFAQAIEECLPTRSPALEITDDQPTSADFEGNATFDEKKVESVFEGQGARFEALMSAGKASVEHDPLSREQSLVGSPE